MEEELFLSSCGSPPPLIQPGLLPVSSSLVPPNWQCPTAVEAQFEGMSGGSAQFLDINWSNSMDRSAPFESAMSSFVSSPASGSNSGVPADSELMGDLIERLGGLYHGRRDLSPPQMALAAAAGVERGASSAQTPCYNIPSNSSPNSHLLMQGPHQINRKSPAMASNSTAPAVGPFFVDGSAKLSKLFGKTQASSSSQDAEASTAVSGKGSRCSHEPNVRKRKAKGKEVMNSSASRKDAKDVFCNENSMEKRCKAEQIEGINKEKSSSPKGKSSSTSQFKDSKPPEKDYIHVRARRGQATDSHSLAERVRREKINERMKLLQDLVPGCNKVAGKALMLDEIINYVQSLQQQVEFLSMKLAHVNPRVDFNMEALLSKDISQSCGPLPQTLYSLDSTVFSHGPRPHQGQHQAVLSSGFQAGNPIDAALHRALKPQPPTTQRHGHLPSEPKPPCEDDLHGIIGPAHRY